MVIRKDKELECLDLLLDQQRKDRAKLDEEIRTNLQKRLQRIKTLSENENYIDTIRRQMKRIL